jgi:hypothetical protein
MPVQQPEAVERAYRILIIVEDSYFHFDWQKNNKRL